MVIQNEMRRISKIKREQDNKLKLEEKIKNLKKDHMKNDEYWLFYKI